MYIITVGSWILLVLLLEHCVVHYIPLINREWGHYREISDRGLDFPVVTKRTRLISYFLVLFSKRIHQGRDFPVMTKRTRLISYLLNGLSNTILKKNTIKTPEVIFHIRLRALWLSSLLILKKYLYASFSFSYWKFSWTLSSCFLVFCQKSHQAEKNFHNARSLQENNARLAANQSMRTIVAI